MAVWLPLSWRTLLCSAGLRGVTEWCVALPPEGRRKRWHGLKSWKPRSKIRSIVTLPRYDVKDTREGGGVGSR